MVKDASHVLGQSSLQWPITKTRSSVIPKLHPNEHIVAQAQAKLSMLFANIESRPFEALFAGDRAKRCFYWPSQATSAQRV